MANQYRSVLASSGPAPTGGDALPAEVLAGKSFTNDNGAQIGTMPNRGAVTQTISGGQSYTIPEGYHNGNGIVTSTGVSVPNGYIFGIDSSGSLEIGHETLTYTVGATCNAFIFCKGYTSITGNYGVVNGVKADGTTVELGNLGTTSTINITDYDMVYISGQVGSVSCTYTIS